MYKDFLLGNFTVKKTGCAFSNIALDQAHEQNNASVKDDGGTVGLTQTLQSLRQWMVFGPEIEKFQASIKKPEAESHLRHHEQTKSVQVSFFNQVKVLSNTYESKQVVAEGTTYCLPLRSATRSVRPVLAS